ncbi:hypothetical protein IW262DRAFT_1292818 [Armillaria fumosa]|nr:hypothetical protein IW262DRAFT_1292818 [Armillaria fumosa]
MSKWCEGWSKTRRCFKVRPAPKDMRYSIPGGKWSIFYPLYVVSVDLDADDEYKFEEEEYSEEFLRSVDKAESDAIAKPFFNLLVGPLSDAEHDEDDDLDSHNETETSYVHHNTGNELVAVMY